MDYEVFCWIVLLIVTIVFAGWWFKDDSDPLYKGDDSANMD